MEGRKTTKRMNMRYREKQKVSERKGVKCSKGKGRPRVLIEPLKKKKKSIEQNKFLNHNWKTFQKLEKNGNLQIKRAYPERIDPKQ